MAISMFDYKGIEALYHIIELQSFSSAAKHLDITQSAVSQRLKSLQEQYGDPLLLKTQPYAPTDVGSALLAHYRKVAVLEQDTSKVLNDDSTPLHLTISLSKDMLDTWFLEILGQHDILSQVQLELISDNQAFSMQHFKSGKASCCFTTTSTTIANCTATFVGYMNYIMVASPDYVKKYFKKQVPSKEELLTAPALAYDVDDALHEDYLSKFFGLNDCMPNYHMVPSAQAFCQLVKQGSVYALVPEAYILDDVKNGDIVSLFPDKIWKLPIYLHHWSFGHRVYNHSISQLISYAKEVLE